MSAGRSVVITGVGVVSPLGTGNAAFWSALVAGRSGVDLLPAYRETVLPVKFGAAVQEFDGKQYITPRKALKVMSREIQFGVAAAAMALDDAALKTPLSDPDRFGVVFGCDMLYCDPEEVVDAHRQCLVDGEFHFELWGTRALPQLFPLWMLKYLPNMAACHIGIAHDARGPNNTITLGEASSLLALLEGAAVIERGHADVMICGGSGSRLMLTPMLYRGDSNLSHRHDDPAGASRPFDAGRDGMVNGEGAAAFVLESLEHAQARRAGNPVRFLGGGSTFGVRTEDCGPFRAAIERSIRLALQASGLGAGEIGHVNAHGASTRQDDPPEAQAIAAQLGDVPVTAPKSYFGNCGGGGGAIELAVTLLGLRHNAIPPTRNYTTSDPDCPVRVIADAPLCHAAPTALVLNQSGTGQVVAVAVGR